jgi:hypothetical protein
VNTASIEIEIQLLLRTYQSADLVADQLVKDKDWHKLSKEEIDSICKFYLCSCFYSSLAQLLIKNLRNNSYFPWPYFAEALLTSYPATEPEVKVSIIAGSIDQSSISELARSHSLDHFEPSLVELREERQLNIRSSWIQRREDLFHELELLKTQGLFDQEEALLQRLQKMFPADPQVASLLELFKKRRSLELFARRSKYKPRSRPMDTLDPVEQRILLAIEQSQHEALANSPEMAADFSVSHWMWDNPEAALRILEDSPASPSTDWLHLELLLKSRHYIDVLEVLPGIEAQYPLDPDTTWAAIYYRAQALWGLQQKKQAVEMLESLCALQPDFRSAAILLEEWKDDYE